MSRRGGACGGLRGGLIASVSLGRTVALLLVTVLVVWIGNLIWLAYRNVSGVCLTTGNRLANNQKLELAVLAHRRGFNQQIDYASYLTDYKMRQTVQNFLADHPGCCTITDVWASNRDPALVIWFGRAVFGTPSAYVWIDLPSSKGNAEENSALEKRKRTLLYKVSNCGASYLDS